QRPSDRLEIGRPIFLTYGLDHLDAGDGVERAGDIAIVDELDVHPVSQPRPGEAHLGPGLLLLGQSEAGDVNAIVARRDLGERAPAAADLEQALTGPESEP